MSIRHYFWLWVVIHVVMTILDVCKMRAPIHLLGAVVRQALLATHTTDRHWSAGHIHSLPTRPYICTSLLLLLLFLQPSATSPTPKDCFDRMRVAENPVPSLSFRQRTNSWRVNLDYKTNFFILLHRILYILNKIKCPKNNKYNF